MKPRFLGFFPARTAKRNRRPAPSVRPRLEALEERLTPTLTYHGGAILASVQAQAVYLGAGWNGQAGQFNNFLSTLVSGTAAAPSSYLALLKNAGFTGVTGAGSALAGVTDSTDLAAATTTQTVYDSQIQSDLANAIQAGGAIQQPNANTLYVVFVEPNAVVSFANGENSTNTFLAYHSSFSDSLDGGATVRYAVVPTHGGVNAQDPWLDSFDSMTVAASHETAEAITDPDGTAYFDRSGNEIGDVVNGSTVYIHDATGDQYAVQREGSIPASLTNFLPMTPAGATAGHQAAFKIDAANGLLDVSENGGVTYTQAADPSGETGQVRAISAASVDDFGQPMIDVVFKDGKAYEYHDFPAGNLTGENNPSFFPWTSLGSNVKQAAAGQAVSYVLFTNGSLKEYVDPNYSTYYYGYGVNPGAKHGVIASGVTGITAVGLDTLGGNAVVYSKVVSGKTVSYEWRDVTASASQTSSTSPTSGLHHSELPTALGNSLTAAPSQTADLILLNALTAPSPVSFAPASQATPLPFAPSPRGADASSPQTIFHAALPDGGGGGDAPFGQQANGTAAVAADGSAAAPAVADLPLLGPLFTEAVRRLQEARFALPAEMWQAVPMRQDTAPAPTKGQPPALPQSKGDHAHWIELGVSALPVAAGLCGAGVEQEVRRRRERLLKDSVG